MDGIAFNPVSKAVTFVGEKEDVYGDRVAGLPFCLQLLCMEQVVERRKQRVPLSRLKKMETWWVIPSMMTS